MKLSQGMTSLVISVLRRRLAKGVYSGRLPGERVLAEELGANPKTIQNALIRLEALGLVRRKARSGTYAVAPGDRAKEGAVLYARLVARSPILPQGDTDFWASLIIYGFQSAAQARGITMALEYAASADAVVQEAIVEAKSTSCVGTCLLSMAVEMKDALRLAASRSNIVLADWDLEEPVVPCVGFDNVGAGRLAGEYLMRQGHRRIAFLAPAPSSPSIRDRRTGADAVLRENALRLVPIEFDRGEVHTAFDRAMSLPEPSTGIIVATPRPADTVIELAAHRGIAVPRTLSVITFGDPRVQQQQVTRVATDHEALGRRAFEMLLDEKLLANPRRVLIPVHLVEGPTTAVPG